MTITLSILITAFREAATVGQAIEAFLAQLSADSRNQPNAAVSPDAAQPQDVEVLVISPDPETLAVVDDYAARYPFVRPVADAQQGKPAAINVGLKAARGDIVVLSDGDVVVAEDALAPLLAPFDDPQVGAVSGQPVSLNPRDTILGYWSHLLVESIHRMRMARDQAGQFLFGSGYLLAFRRALVEHIPKDALAEDAVLSQVIADQGYRICYAPQARVLVKYPTTYRDWLRQKVRSAGGHAQDYVRKSSLRMRSAWLEMRYGGLLALRYPRSLREFLWTLLLFAARLHLWLLVFVNVRLLRRSLKDLWQRVETTK
jgi:cellulose synthase/poly-beta-1,6-N-acetylglucosamine synthase-like glycosyltransferase